MKISDMNEHTKYENEKIIGRNQAITKKDNKNQTIIRR